MLKLILFFTLIFSVGQLSAQIVNIPDPHFKNRLLLHSVLSYPYNGVLIDTNGNGEIEVSEAEAVTSGIYVQGDSAIWGEIEDMTGVEAFINATVLNCGLNVIDYLDLSQNLSLEVVDCKANGLNTLILGNNSVLNELWCNINNLTHLDVSQNTGLEELWCYENGLTGIDISQNSVLKGLSLNYNDISALDVSQNLLLNRFDCQYNQFTELDVTNNPMLISLQCGYNQLNNLDVSQNPLLEGLSFANNNISSIDISECSQLIRIWGEGNQLTDIDLSSNPNLGIVSFSDNQLANMDISNGNNGIIGQFVTTGNPNLTCIFVDDAEWSTENWTNIDENSTFVETQAECDALSTNDFEFDDYVHVYPNPTNDLLNIRLSYGIEINEVVLYNHSGNTIIKTNKNLIDVSRLNTGFYILRIITIDDRIISKRIMIKI